MKFKQTLAVLLFAGAVSMANAAAVNWGAVGAMPNNGNAPGYAATDITVYLVDSSYDPTLGAPTGGAVLDTGQMFFGSTVDDYFWGGSVAGADVTPGTSITTMAFTNDGAWYLVSVTAPYSVIDTPSPQNPSFTYTGATWQPVPEPGTMLLAIAGIGAFWVRRRKRK